MFSSLRWSGSMKRWLRGVVLMFATGVLSAQVLAGTGEVRVAGLDDLEARIAYIEEISLISEDLQGSDRDGFQFRLDQLMLEAIGSADKALLEVMALEPDAGVVVRERAETLAIWLLEASISRLEEIYGRIKLERSAHDEFEGGVSAHVSRAFVQDLTTMVLEYMNALGILFRVGEQFGVSVEGERDMFQQFAARNVEQLHGQIRLDARTLSELRRGLAADASNAGIESALRAVGHKQTRNLANMAAWLELLDDLGVDTVSHRSLLIQQRGRIGTEILQRGVFANIWRDQAQRIWRNAARNGPNFILQLFTFLAVLLLAWIVAHAIRRALKMIMDSSLVRLSQLMEDRLLSLSFGLMFLAGIIVALATIGWSVMPMLAGLGVAGLVVGFALQDSLKSFVAGWMILVYQAYDVGDYVQVAGTEGKVRRMTLSSTRIATRDNTIKLVPNRKIWEDTIVNLTASRARRLELEVCCDSGNDMDQVENVIRELLAEHPQILNRPRPEVYLSDHGTSEMTFLVQPWVRTEEYWVMRRALLKEIRQRFKREGIR